MVCTRVGKGFPETFQKVGSLLRTESRHNRGTTSTVGQPPDCSGGVSALSMLAANLGVSLVAQVVKNLLVIWETWIRSLSLEDSLEKGMAPHSSILAWRIPMDRGAWWATVHGVTESDTTKPSTAQPIFTVSRQKIPTEGWHCTID